MINFTSAFETNMTLAQNNLFLQKTEMVELFQLHNRVLAEDIFSDTDLPPFDKSAVDG